MSSTSPPPPWKKQLQSLQHENTRLKAELRFANGLIAALLVVVFWGYWHQPEPSSGQPLPKRKAQRKTSAQQPDSKRALPVPLRKRSHPTIQRTSLRPTQRLQPRRWPTSPRQAKRKVLRAPRFGDPLAPEEAPAQWCKPSYIYSFFYPCLQRGSQRKCLRRSRRRRYTCIPRSWWRRRQKR
ncbi:MAG: hypothetical protein EP343_22380 [Deltaproteobacteria bacterium]|nr:MAG: hypothetical protein EP343_22380 [Deltaproteobacteria bacterium]